MHGWGPHPRRILTKASLCMAGGPHPRRILTEASLCMAGVRTPGVFLLKLKCAWLGSAPQAYSY